MQIKYNGITADIPSGKTCLWPDAQKCQYLRQHERDTHCVLFDNSSSITRGIKKTYFCWLKLLDNYCPMWKWRCKDVRHKEQENR